MCIRDRLSLGAQFKPEYYSKDTDFTKYTHNVFAGGNPYGGWSSIGNPGTFLIATDDGNAATTNDPTVLLGDPGCNRSGGYHDTGAAAAQSLKFTDANGATVGTPIDLNGYQGLCRYNYAYFDNVQEEQKNNQLWMEFNGDINDHNFHVEFAYGKTDVPQYATSPAYPPNNPNSTFVPNNHPGLQALYVQNPNFLTLLSRNELNGSTVTDNSSPCLLYTSPSPRDATLSRMPSSA